MGRLIDIEDMVFTGQYTKVDGEIYVRLSDYETCLYNQPTAYDVDAVVKELEELAKLHARHQLKCEVKGMDYCADRHEHKVQALDEAIAIVKRGGRNE